MVREAELWLAARGIAVSASAMAGALDEVEHRARVRGLIEGLTAK